MSIRILLADDHNIIREGLRSLLDEQPDMEVVAQAENGHSAVYMVREMLPDIAIMDVTMPDLNGIEATQKIVSECPNVKVIALSMHSDTLYVTEMLKSGASGYLLKDCAFEELEHAILAVTKGQIYLSPRIAGTVMKDYLVHVSEDDDSGDELSAREREVLQLIVEGKKTKQIAETLNVSVKTVETHRRQIMKKLNIHSIAELTKYALREGLTSLES